MVLLFESSISKQLEEIQFCHQLFDKSIKNLIKLAIVLSSKKNYVIHVFPISTHFSVSLHQ